ncbi:MULTISPECIES: hypothetical protein [Metallosphaera]|uniref:SHSP domain-containing protein n=4 Tax=Metallosphaera TaxID=41980 RepID=A4YIR7_METS5|nr:MULTISPECIES: hypothetical protein [Metallosphaera]ABP96319.1 hypothetical protein Msed_2180 [Metallosphaera sedula DSM 5348]AIM28302.1 hypothetical protein HA72_2180 [Metallosphaera sedula]AKV75103.1 hypothetical protein MsedA_2232 [Metallosphaera sedula]AKV77341.1 hypothetical protein MsedB_2234 [Metallosphaera sedula]AKV79592.1 hypothetical protein MsedC_2232 [Metallosphaera sedula]
MPSVQIDDADVDILTMENRVNVYIDLRGMETRESSIAIRADISTVYVYDMDSRNVIKIVRLPVQIKTSPVSYYLRNGVLGITLERL